MANTSAKAKVPTVNGLTQSHLAALDLLDPEEYRSAAELREAGAVQTVGRCLSTMTKRGYAEVTLLGRPDLIAKKRQRYRSSTAPIPNVPTKCYRITRRGQKAAAEARAKFAELEASKATAPETKRGTQTGRAPAAGRLGHPWAFGGQGVTG